MVVVAAAVVVGEVAQALGGVGAEEDAAPPLAVAVAEGEEARVEAGEASNKRRSIWGGVAPILWKEGAEGEDFLKKKKKDMAEEEEEKEDSSKKKNKVKTASMLMPC